MLYAQNVKNSYRNNHERQSQPKHSCRKVDMIKIIWVTLLFLITSCATIADIKNIPKEQGVAKYYEASSEYVSKAAQMALSSFTNIKIIEVDKIDPNIWVITADVIKPWYGTGPEFLRVTIESHKVGSTLRVLSQWKSKIAIAPSLDYSKSIFQATDKFLNNIQQQASYPNKESKSGKTFIEKKEDKIISIDTKGKNGETQSLDALETLIQANPQSFVKRSIFGIYVTENNNKEIEIYRVIEKSTASKADIRIGDCIISVDNVEIKNRSQLFELIYERKNPGETIEVVLKRKKAPIKKTITPTTDYILKDTYALLYEITKNRESINLAITVNEINNVYLQGAALEQWKATMKPLLNSIWENYYLSFLLPEKNFSLIDRDKISNVINELKMQQSGLVDVASQQKLGNMLGASHLLVIDYSRSYVSNIEALDIETHKLIEVKSGKILASVPLQIKQPAKTDSDVQESNSSLMVKKDFINYYNELMKIRPAETEAANAYGNVTGNNYSNDLILYNTLVDVVIPKYTLFTKKLHDIKPTTDEVKSLHKAYVEATDFFLEHYDGVLIGLQKQDINLITKANEKMELGIGKIKDFKSLFNSILKKYNINNIQSL